MVADSSNSRKRHKQPLNIDQCKKILDWIRLLQQALTVEAETGFSNLEGRHERFSIFISKKLDERTKATFPSEIESRLDVLVKAFSSYNESTEKERRRLVVDTRHFLNSLSKNYQPEEKLSTPKLKLSDLPDPSLIRARHKGGGLSLESPLGNIYGIGPKFAERLAGLGLLVVRDLLNYYPRDYVDYSCIRRIDSLETGKTATIVATVRRCNAFKSPRNPNLSILELQLVDQTGRLKVTRFFAGRRFSSYANLKKQSALYRPGATVAVSGLVKDGPYGMNFQDPLIEVMESLHSPLRSKNIGRLLPVYALTEGITADQFRALVDKVLPYATLCSDPLPEPRRKVLKMPSRQDALITIHQPRDQKTLQVARRRLVFDEFLLLQLGFLRRRASLSRCSAPPLECAGKREGLVGEFLNLLPFTLTRAQARVLAEIELDLVRSEPMARLVQGDVGSGKTIVALASLLNAVQAGWQGALMAPTEVLAEQHYQTFCNWLPYLHVSVDLLTGSTSQQRRRKILDDLANGSLKILVGTHALIEDPVAFSRLGLVVVDEQHRFGVHQRNRLLGKGLQPHLLTMTATPIPRTLALSMHGDLDLSQIDELPPGRLPIQTRLLSGSDREQAYQLIRDEIAQGKRAYVVLPLIEDSEKLDLRSAVMVYKELSESIFPELSVGLLHGRMSSSEKQDVIQSFQTGDCQVLVSTTVIEVGVDVPQATVMLIEHADRFGLAQLHQLRGRVGRGKSLSHCLLVNNSSNPLAKDRLQALVRSNDGFEIADIDLRFRGPGQVLGTRQSGLPDFALASLTEDGAVLEEARSEAVRLLAGDPELKKNPGLRKALDDHWQRLSGNSHLN